MTNKQTTPIKRSRVSLDLEPHYIRRLDQLAKRNQRDRSKQLRFLIVQAIDAEIEAGTLPPIESEEVGEN